MELAGTTVVVTGGGSGIGAALCRAFAEHDAARIVVADLDADAAGRVAEQVDGEPAQLDVTDEAAVGELVARLTGNGDGRGGRGGQGNRIDLWCGNAGIATTGGVEVPDDAWQRTWEVNVMAHVWAMRALLPLWRASGGGHYLVTASAAGLLTNPGAAPYAVTKHGAVALAEWLAMTHHDDGVVLHCLCPQFVDTPMLHDSAPSEQVAQLLLAIARTPEEVAATTVEALRADRFLILPHPEVAEYEQRRASDRERWLAGVRRLDRDMRG